MNWGLTWLGFFGGIALLVWVFSRPDPAQQLCTQQRGSWVRVDANKNGYNGYYTCKFGIK